AWSTPSGTVVSTPASGSSKSVPNAHCEASPASRSPSKMLSWSFIRGLRSHVRDVPGDLVERRVPVDLVAAGREQGVLLVRAGRGDRVGADHPDAHALVAARVDVPRVPQRHRVVGGVQRPDVHVVEPPLAADEHLVQRPFPPARALRAHAAPPSADRFANARAASRTQAPSSWAARRWASRCALHGPLPLMTAANSSQSGSL